MAQENLGEVREHSAGLANVAWKALRSLTKLPTRAQALETEVKFLKSQINEVGKTGNDAVSSANEKGRKAKLLESSTVLLRGEID